jgi:hypothetical protein
MGRRILNRKDLRADYEAAEARRKGEDEEDVEEGEEGEDEDEDEDEDEGEEAAEGEEEGGGGGGDEEDEEEAPPKKKKKPAKVKEPKPKRVRTPKHVRQKVVWVVFDNSSKKIAAYDYPKKKEAEDHAARLKAEKNQTFFVQPVKENMEEK